MSIEKFKNIKDSQTFKYLVGLGFNQYENLSNEVGQTISLQKKIYNDSGICLFFITAKLCYYPTSGGARFLDFDAQFNCDKTTLNISTVQKFNRFYTTDDDFEIYTIDIEKVEKYFSYLYEQLNCEAYDDYSTPEITDSYIIDSLENTPSNVKRLHFSTIVNQCKSRGLPIEKISELFGAGEYELIIQLLFK